MNGERKIGVGILIIIGLLAFSSSGTAFDARTFLDNGFDAEGKLTLELQGQLAQATAQFQQLPAPVQSLFGNQRVKFELTRDDGVMDTLGITLQNNQILDVVRRAPENPTLLVQTDEETLNQIAQSPDAGAAFLNAVNTGRVHYQGLDLGTSAVTFVAGALLWVTNLLAGIAQLFGL